MEYLQSVAGEAEASGAFTTPSVVHFGVVLLLSALASAPWNGVAGIALLWGVVGVSGFLYTAFVARRLRAQTVYKPVLEDWLFHMWFPSAAYATLTVAACIVCNHARAALFLVAAASLLLLFIGIHNAWDTVTHLVFVRRQAGRDDGERRGGGLS
ncbi:MAG TPA: hypothetical protein VN848_07020 [Gemmatimonadales bacterium]|nr:hypothetical protein [Gemmatimonadales bacterium]